MHGNVEEWCADPWHDSYEGAPRDGRVWLANENDNDYYLLRGGSWVSNPRLCRSAYRVVYFVGRDGIYDNVGFRVRCGVVGLESIELPVP